MKYSDKELLQATEALMKELGVDNPRARSFGFHHLWAASILRVFIKDMHTLDDAGITHLSYPDGTIHSIDGFDASRQETNLRAKWSTRASGWTHLHKDDLDYITDWLWAAASGVHHWLADQDDKGRPKKIMKCGSIQALAHEAEKMNQKRNASGGLKRKPLGSGDVQCIADLDGGLYLHRLLSARALDVESRIMDHCVGDGDYDEALRDPHHLILSIRDSSGNQLATAEVANGVVEQVVGPSNMSPPRYVAAAFEKYRLSVGWRNEFEVWSAQRIRAMAYIGLSSQLGWTYKDSEYAEWLMIPEADQEADLAMMRAAAELLPPVEPRARVDWRPEVEQFEPDPSSFHIVLDDDGGPVVVEIDNDALDPFRPR